MALIDVVTWTPDGGEFIFAYKYPESNLSTYTQLVVYESQEALLFSKGELMGQFGPGKHQLNTENLPILSSLYGLPFNCNTSSKNEATQNLIDEINKCIVKKEFENAAERVPTTSLNN